MLPSGCMMWCGGDDGGGSSVRGGWYNGAERGAMVLFE